MRKLLSLLFCVTLLFSYSTSLAQVNHPDYINYDSALPIIPQGNEEGENIVLTMMVGSDAVAGKWDDLWVKKFIEDYFNVTLKVEQIPETALMERNALLFASGDLPDIMMNLSFTTSNIVMFGQVEGQLLKLDEYMDETLTPNILSRFEALPDALTAATTPDGHIYSLPKIGENMDGTSLDRVIYNTVWRQACGLEDPRTLDEFLDMLRAFKQQDPGKVGSENVVPLGGGYEASNPGWYILNALGFVGDKIYGDENLSYGVRPTLLNGECVLPVGNDLFKTYLETMKTMYSEGLLAKNFFLLDRTEMTGQILNNYVGAAGETRIDAFGLTTWTQWEAARALTSESNPQAAWYKPVSAEVVGNFAVSANTKYPELCMRIADFFFSDEARIFWIGPVDGSDEAMGYLGRTKVSTAVSVASKPLDKTRFPAGIADNWSYAVGYLTFPPRFGAIDMFDSVYYYHMVYHDGEEADPSVLNPEFADHFFRISGLAKLTDSLEAGFPVVYYLDDETTYRLTELSTIIDPYVKEQVALFITGERSLDSFEDFQAALDGMGFQEYQGIYQQVWLNTLSNQ